MKNGGARPGAGRKKKPSTLAAEQARNILAQMVYNEITPLGKQLLKQAKRGNVVAMKELFDRAFGRAPQALEVKGMLAISQLLDKAEKDNE